jgi:hypothetical protein
MATRIQTVAKTRSETRIEDPNSNGFQKAVRNERAEKLNGDPEITGAYLSFDLHKETRRPHDQH